MTPRQQLRNIESAQFELHDFESLAELTNRHRTGIPKLLLAGRIRPFAAKYGRWNNHILLTKKEVERIKREERK